MRKILAIDCWPTQGDPNQVLLSGTDQLRMIGGPLEDWSIVEAAKFYVDRQADLAIANSFIEVCGIIIDCNLDQEIWFSRCFLHNIRQPAWVDDEPTFWYQWDTIKGIQRLYPSIEFAIPLIRESAIGWSGVFKNGEIAIHFRDSERVKQINERNSSDDSIPKRDEDLSGLASN